MRPKILTRAPTGGADIRPRRFFVDSEKTAAHSSAKFGIHMTIPSSFLHSTYVQVVTFYLEWSRHQFSLKPDLTSPFLQL